MLDELIGEVVVVDLQSTYVALGTLRRVDQHYVELANADVHDMRDSDSTREHYIAAAASTGIKRNRKRVLIARADVAAVSRLADVVDD